MSVVHPLAPSPDTFLLKGGLLDIHNRIKGWERKPASLIEDLPQMSASMIAQVLEMAAHHGALEVVRSCLKIRPQECDQSACNNALINASKEGHIYIVRLLLPKSDPLFSESAALRQAVENVHVDIVKLLIPLSDPKVFDCVCLRLACEYGQAELIELLLPVSYVSARFSECLWRVCQLPDIQASHLIDLILPHSDALSAATRLNEKCDYISLERLLSKTRTTDFMHICAIIPQAHDAHLCPIAHIRWCAEHLKTQLGQLGKENERRKM